MTSKNSKIDLFKIADNVFDRLAAKGYAGLADPERVFVCVWALDGEVNNGGFDQYFFNSSGDLALDTPGALLKIGAEKTAAIVSDANALFGAAGPDPDRDTRQAQLEALSDKKVATMEDLDQRFYDRRDNIELLLSKYVAKHKTALASK